jgi:hypothetical protein
VTLTLVGLAYVVSIPLTLRASHRLRRDYQARQEQMAEPRLSTPAGAPARTPSPAESILPEGDAPSAEWRHERRAPQQPLR